MYNVLLSAAVGIMVSSTAKLWETAWPTTADAGDLSGTAARPTHELEG